jgi:hypothetical protein
LLQASTEITIRNGEKATFWQDMWLQGKVPEKISQKRDQKQQLDSIRSVHLNKETTTPVYQLMVYAKKCIPQSFSKRRNPVEMDAEW